MCWNSLSSETLSIKWFLSSSCLQFLHLAKVIFVFTFHNILEKNSRNDNLHNVIRVLFLYKASLFFHLGFWLWILTATVCYWRLSNVTSLCSLDFVFVRPISYLISLYSVSAVRTDILCGQKNVSSFGFAFCHSIHFFGFLGKYFLFGNGIVIFSPCKLFFSRFAVEKPNSN